MRERSPPNYKFKRYEEYDAVYRLMLKEDETYKSIDDAPPWFEKDSESLRLTTSIPNS